MRKLFALVLAAALAFGLAAPAWADHNPVHVAQQFGQSPKAQYAVVGTAMSIVAWMSGETLPLLVPVAIWYGFYRCFYQGACEPLEERPAELLEAA